MTYHRSTQPLVTLSCVTLSCVALALVSLAPLSAGSVQDHDEDAPTAAEITKAGTIFAKACVSCHLPPDPEHATDRAWLHQVKDTA